MKSALPSKDDFLDYFKHNEVNSKAIELFQEHYNAPGRAATAGELASAVQYRSHSAVNLNYGILSGKIIKYWIKAGRWSQTDLLNTLIEHDILDENQETINPNLSIFMKRFSHDRYWTFYMSDSLADALEEMGWVKRKHRSSIVGTKEDPDDPASYEEGGVKYRSIRQYERSIEARRKCIAANGDLCAVCGLSFGKKYGADFSGLIVVHHLNPMAIGENRKTDATNDLKPLCPNCHAMAHFGRPGKEPRPIEELKRILNK